MWEVQSGCWCTRKSIRAWRTGENLAWASRICMWKTWRLSREIASAPTLRRPGICTACTDTSRMLVWINRLHHARVPAPTRVDNLDHKYHTTLLLQTCPIAQEEFRLSDGPLLSMLPCMIDPTTLHNQRSPMCLKRDGHWDAIPVTQSLPLHFMDSRKRCLYLKSEWNDQLSWMKWWFFTVPLNSNILCKNDRPGCTTLQACCSLLIRGCKSYLVQHFLCSQPAIRLLALAIYTGASTGLSSKCQSQCPVMSKLLLVPPTFPFGHWDIQPFKDNQ